MCLYWNTFFGRRNNNFETKICNYIKFVHGYHSADLLGHGLGWGTATLSLGIAVSRKMIILSLFLYPMTLQPNLGLDLFNSARPSISVFANLLQFFHFNILLASLSNASIDLPQVPPNSLLPSMHFQCFFWARFRPPSSTHDLPLE